MWECNIMSSQQMTQALMSLIVKTVAQKNVYTLWHEKYYSVYTKAKLIWDMSLNFGFIVGVRSGHHRHPNTVEPAELLHEPRSVMCPAVRSRPDLSLCTSPTVPSISNLSRILAIVRRVAGCVPNSFRHCRCTSLMFSNLTFWRRNYFFNFSTLCI